MAVSFIELLKDVENADKAGFTQGKGWVPHTSAEGGTRTLAYGHKLSPREEKGNFVELPDGTIVDFDDRGLTDQEAEALLMEDISRSQRIAAKQWDQYQDVPYESLSPLQQSLLSEIVFNVGTLKNEKGDFGWPSLAEGIKKNDTEAIKQEISRSFVDPQGNKKELTRRVERIREYIDNPEPPKPFTPTQPTGKGQQDQQNGSQTPSGAGSLSMSRMEKLLQRGVQGIKSGVATGNLVDTTTVAGNTPADKKRRSLLDRAVESERSRAIGTKNKTPMVKVNNGTPEDQDDRQNTVQGLF